MFQNENNISKKIDSSADTICWWLVFNLMRYLKYQTKILNEYVLIRSEVLNFRISNYSKRKWIFYRILMKRWDRPHYFHLYFTHFDDKLTVCTNRYRSHVTSMILKQFIWIIPILLMFKLRFVHTTARNGGVAQK